MSEIVSNYLLSSANLLAYYRLESGALTTDTKATNTLTNNNTVASSSAGKYGACADFGLTNSNKYLSLGNGLGIDLSTSAWSVALWFNQNSASNPSSGNAFRLFDWRSTTGTARACSIDYKNNGGTMQLDVFGMGTDIPFNTTLAAGWHSIIVTCTAGGSITIYLDNASVATGSRGTTAGGSNAIAIGADIVGTTTLCTSGLIDEVAFFNAALSTNDVAAIFNALSGGILASDI